MSLPSRITYAIDQGKLSGRLWLYSNYHCNLACRYCLTESAPSSPKRQLSLDSMMDVVHQARELGFRAIGVTGGEPFMLPYIEEFLLQATQILPVTVLTNGTLFHQRRLDKLSLLKEHDFRLQISLDSHNPVFNDTMRGPNNFARVVEAIPKLLALGIRVRVATTLTNQSESEIHDVQHFVKKLGVPEEDHLIRKTVQRGRAVTEELGVKAPLEHLVPELTITAEGAFWSPFSPTYIDGRLQSDLLLSRTIAPLSVASKILLDFMQSLEGVVPQDSDELEGFV